MKKFKRLNKRIDGLGVTTNKYKYELSDWNDSELDNAINQLSNGSGLSEPLQQKWNNTRKLDLSHLSDEELNNSIKALQNGL